MKRSKQKINRIINTTLAGFSHRFGFSLNRPINIILNPTNRCNLRCRHCNIWQEENIEELDTAQWQKVIDDLAKWLPGFQLTLNGGEIFLRNDIFEIINHGKNRGLNIGINTNGTLIDKKIAKQLMESDINMVEVSYYSFRPEVHDELRGLPGTWQKANNAIKHLLNYKNELKKNTLLLIAFLVNEKNYQEIPQMIKWADKNKMQVSLQPLDYNLSRMGKMNDGGAWHKDYALWPKDNDSFSKIWQKVIALKKQGLAINNQLEQLQLMEKYYENPFSLQEMPCLAGQMLFIVGTDGQVYLCFRRGAVGSILQEKPAQIWRGREAKNRREEFKKCRLTCRVMNCNFKSSIVRNILKK